MFICDFFSVVADDVRITASHISLYLAIYAQWVEQGSPGEICVDRPKLMNLSKIGGRSTYDKCLHDLHDFRYVAYYPARAKGKSRVVLRKLV